jgi:hypothetical protein
MSDVAQHLDSAVNRDMQEFEAKILDAATAASKEDQEASKRIVDRSDEVTVETITPVIAALLFVELNKHNRDFSLPKAHAYAIQMSKGYWRLVHQGLAFYQDRKLADGQHRIAATFLSGTTQQFTVFRNFAHDALEAIDTAKRRTAGDAFGITGLVPKDDAKIAGSIVEAVMKYEERRTHARSFTPSIYEQKDWLKAHIQAVKDALAIVHKVVKDDPVLNKPEAGAIALAMLIGGYANEETESFLDDVMQSVGRYADSPAVSVSVQYRKSKERDAAKGKLTKEEKLALAFKAAALCHNKMTTGGVRWKAGKEPLPAPVPPDVFAKAAE